MRSRRQRAYFKVRAAIQAVEAGQLEAAQQRLQEALDLYPECVEARLWLGHVAERQGETLAGLRQYRVGLALTPGEPQLIAAFGRAQGAVHSAYPLRRELQASYRSARSNLVFAALVPPAGFLLGLYELLTARTQEMRRLGSRTVCTALLGLCGYILVYLFRYALR